MTEPGCPRVPLAHYPGMNRFVLDWLGGDERFLPRRPVPRVTRNVSPELVQALVDSNKHWGLFVRPQVERWAAGAPMIVAGQQTGFAGGPLYTIAKIATLLKMKRELGEDAVVFFWLATEDHDFAEVAQLTLPVRALPQSAEVNRQLDLVQLRAIRSTDSHEMVGPAPVPETLIAQLLSFYGGERPQWLREGITFRDSFAELIASIFGNEIVLVDALLPELRRAGAPLFDQIRAKWNDAQLAITKRSLELSEAGYTPQVVPREGEDYTLLFAIDDDGVNRAPSRDVVSPERTSTSALTRPLLQDLVLAPDVFVGGPAEVAYYAQIAPLHELFGIPMPRVALRGHALIAPKRIVRAFDRYGIDPSSIFTSADKILAEHEPEGVAQVNRIADGARRELIRHIEELAEIALPADHAVARAFTRSVGHIEYHFDKLVERSIRGLVRKDRERHAATRELVATFFPDRHVQDRVVGWYAYWCEQGERLVDALVECIEPDSDHFRIVSL